MTKTGKKTLQSVLIIIFYIGYVSYIYYKPSIINENTLTEVNGLLLDSPSFEESNGDNVPNIRFEIIGESRKYKIKSCGLDQIDFNQMMSLKLRDEISFKVLKKDNQSIREKMNSQLEVFEVFEVKTSSGVTLLSLSDYNFCKKNSWKDLFLITALMIITLIFTLLQDVFNKPSSRRKGNHSI